MGCHSSTPHLRNEIERLHEGASEIPSDRRRMHTVRIVERGRALHERTQMLIEQCRRLMSV